MKDTRLKRSQCEHIAGDAHSLKVHSLTHAVVASKHRCDKCPKSYNTKGHLNQHKKEHMGRASPCPHCGKTLYSKVVSFLISSHVGLCMVDLLQKGSSVMCAAESTLDRLSSAIMRRRNTSLKL